MEELTTDTIIGLANESSMRYSLIWHDGSADEGINYINEESHTFALQHPNATQDKVDYFTIVLTQIMKNNGCL